MAQPYHRGNSQSNSGSMYRPNSSGWNSKDKGDRASEANITLMEMENNQRWADLGEQVELLKGLSQDINQEVKSQNSLLDGMSAQFGSTTQMFKSTIGKLGVMLNSGSSNHMCYLAFFVVFVFLVIYFFMKWK
mmetsp:Transcript_49875/g.87099  ORF Transcript_49875/g.87099 Transcript_49875/m.87099 type:complete len:133 (-) Transcript_49875:114-512(-)|eukprot:CAMPEP_0185013114 /NCGR_PEP_ID=MMETSP1098-20130426/98643_1 /TAXON_ID=89044 /ORGANISM="Spumella elongata, Strain CCAP 955/1" /LENGTH=132 /DNA_ID=CAMNT_0027542179 /DNA_START=44 /DNA_END=442 /DNA_ORIENTATION=+